MTYRDILHRLEQHYDKGEARALARLVLEERFSLSLTDIMCDKVNDLSREDSKELEKIIHRLENHEPVQYILGYQDFCGHRFHVEPGVLIPRPETEELVGVGCRVLGDGGMSQQQKVSTITHHPSPITRVLDIGTGSGCIAISIALAAKTILSTSPLGEAGKGLYVEAWDISDDALRIAKGNAERLGANVIFKKVDILNEQSISKNSPPPGEDGRGLCLIVSNPPYICQHESSSMEPNVLNHEPHLALFVPDDDPLVFYRAIANYGINALQPGGLLLFEINRAYGTEVCDLLHDIGYINIQLINDQFNNPRNVQAQKSVAESNQGV